MDCLLRGFVELYAVEAVDEGGRVVEAGGGAFAGNDGADGGGGSFGCGDGPSTMLRMVPLPIAARQGGIRRAGAGAGAEIIDRRALAVGVFAVVAEAEHQQAVVILAAPADQAAADEDGDEIAGDRALEGDVLHPRDAIIERRFPGAAELLGAFLAAEVISAFGRHVDHRTGAADRAGVGERLDERLLAFGRPAVVALALAADGGEGGKGRPFPARDGRAILHRRV